MRHQGHRLQFHARIRLAADGPGQGDSGGRLQQSVL